jgi:hypothetical protein
MKKFVLLLTSLLVFNACNDETPPLPPDKLEAILMDLHFAEGYSMMVTDSMHYLREKNKDTLAVFYNDVFKHHGISKEKFMEAMNWYKKHPAELDSVYNSMLPELSILETAYP